MIIKDLKKLKKEKTAKEIIYMHCSNKIFLTDKQLDKLIEEKNRGDKNDRKWNENFIKRLFN